MRNNLTKKQIVNAIYMQIGYSKKISRREASDYFIKYPNLKVIHHQVGYYERKQGA